MSARRLLLLLGMGLALLVGGAPASSAVADGEPVVAAQALPAAAHDGVVRRRRSRLRAWLAAPRVRPTPVQRSRAARVRRLRPSAGHDAPRRAPPALPI